MESSSGSGSPGRVRLPPGALAAAIGAATTLAAQVAGKAARDALFLSHLQVRQLPAMLIASSILSVLAALYAARLMTRQGPARVVPVANLVSAALFLADFWLAGRAPRAAAIAVFANSAILGPVLVSGFWSVVSERFDPHTARRTFAHVGAGATLGGLLGGLLAERVGAVLPLHAVLLPLAALQLFTAWQLRGLARHTTADAALSRTQPVDAPYRAFDALRLATRSAHLRNVAAIVVLGTVAAALLDYVFKSRAAGSLSSAQLLRFFAVFHAVVGLGSLVAQVGLARRALDRLGLAGTIASVPLVVTGFGVGALLAPSLAAATALRGAENVARNSLYRQGYEILYTPLPPREKRALKVIIDVGLERFGDALGGVLVALLLATGAHERPLVILAVAISVASALFSRRLDRGHVDALETSLRNQAVALDLHVPGDRSSRATLLRSLNKLRPRRTTAQAAVVPDPELVVPGPTPRDPWLARAAALRSGDPTRVRAALAQAPVPGELVGLVVRLLAWDAVASAADDALRQVGLRATGQLVDALLDPDEEFAVRRRLPRVLAASTSQRGADGLVAGLADRRFEVRYQCASALVRLRARAGDTRVDEAAIHAAILRELAAFETLGDELRLLDAGEPKAPAAASGRDLEQVFLLLSLILPAEPTRIALSGLVGADQQLRGTALEYLESVLPETLRPRLLPWLGRHVAHVAPAAPAPAAGTDDVRQELIASRESLRRELDALTEVAS